MEALLFDLGGVVIDIDFGRAFERWAVAARVTPDTIRSRFSFDVFYERHERGQIGVAEYFVSSDLGRRKPEPEAFAAIAAEIGVPLGRVLFFDDTKANVDGARAVGMPAVQVRSLDDVANALAEI